MEQCLVIKFKIVNLEAKEPTIHKGNNKLSDIFAAEDVFIAPSETVAVSTGLAFIFPDDIGIMLMPTNDLYSKSSLSFVGRVKVLENSYYPGDEVKINFNNKYSLKEGSKKVHEYKLLDGTVVSDPNNLYVEGTVKIRKGDCIASMMPVDPAYSETDEIPKSNTKSKKN